MAQHLSACIAPAEDQNSASSPYPILGGSQMVVFPAIDLMPPPGLLGHMLSCTDPNAYM